jgi:hypothetical protein
MPSDEMTLKQVAQLELRQGIRHCEVGVYVHYKGGEYIVFAHTVDEDSLALLVHYYSMKRHTRWTRTVKNFCEIIDDKHTPRFRRVRHASLAEWRDAAGIGP